MRDTTQSQIYNEYSLAEQILRECEAMAKCAFASGLEVPGALVESLDVLSAHELDRAGKSTEGGTAGDQPNPTGTASMLSATRPARELAKIHKQLSEIVAPATPRTILLLATEEAKGGFLHFLGPVPLIRRMMLVAIISLVAFIVVSLSPQVTAESIAKNVFHASGVDLLLNLLFLLSAAGLGASFAGLFQANRYVAAGTFDPQYESSYWIRFVLGLMAGIMLSQLIPLGPDPDVAAADPDSVGVLAIPTLAMLGGFSAAVVYRIINRLVETLESLVRGETREIMAAREEAAKTRSDHQSIQNQLKLAANLTSLQQLINSTEDITTVRTELGQALNNLLLNRAEEDKETETAPAKTDAQTGMSPSPGPTPIAPQPTETALPPSPTAESAQPTEAMPAPPRPTIAPSPQSPGPVPPVASSIGQQPARDTLLGAIRYAGMGLRHGQEQTDAYRNATRDLQRHLRALGYLRVGIDGKFGQGTENAIQALQYDLLHNDGTDAQRGEPAPVRVMDYNRGRVTDVTGIADEGTVACVQDILADENFPLLPLSEDPRAANEQIKTVISEMTSDQVPMPFLMAIIEQESSFRHFCVPRGEDEDSYIVVGLDRNDKNVSYRITSRGYGVKQYTLFHHPPNQEEVEAFMWNVEGNLQKGISLLREKFDRFVNGTASTADDRIAEFGDGPLRLCKYNEGDARYMKDCAVCMQEAGVMTIDAGSTPFYEGATDVFNPTRYHRETRLAEVPVRGAVGCDWSYAVRRYNGSGVNSYYYQAKILFKVKSAIT